MSELAERLMSANLLEVFNERDGTRRRAAIERTYAPDVRWTDAEGVVTGRDALEAKCVELQGTLANLEFAAAGPVRHLPGFAYLAWDLRDPAGHTVMSGFDVSVIADGLITDLWTILTPPEP